jgi:hypothetical protein
MNNNNNYDIMMVRGVYGLGIVPEEGIKPTLTREYYID